MPITPSPLSPEPRPGMPPGLDPPQFTHDFDAREKERIDAIIAAALRRAKVSRRTDCRYSIEFVSLKGWTLVQTCG